jgi:hypothetical protein
MVVTAGYAGMVLYRSRAVVDLPRPSGTYPVGRVEDTATDSTRHGRRLSIWTASTLARWRRRRRLQAAS